MELLNSKLNVKMLGIIALALMGVIGIIVLIVMLATSQGPSNVNAGTISLYLSPTNTTITANQSTQLDLYLNAGGNQIGTVNVFFTYDPTKVNITVQNGEIFSLFNASKNGNVYEIQAGGGSGNATPFTSSGILAKLQVTALTNSVDSTQLSITSDTKMKDFPGNLIEISSSIFKAYTYNLGTQVAIKPIAVSLSPSVANITQTDTYLDVNIDTLGQSVQAVRVVFQYDPTQLSIEQVAGTIADFQGGTLYSTNTNSTTLQTDVAVKLDNKAGFNGTGTIERLKVRALTANASSTTIGILSSSQFALNANLWSAIASSSVKNYNYQLNPTVAATTSSKASSSQIASNSLSSSKVSSKLSSSKATTMPNTGVLEDNLNFLMFVFIVLSILAIFGVYKYTKYGSFERKFIK